jgi:hypothetical protein
MKTQNKISIIAGIFLILIITNLNLAKGELEYWQQKNDYGNGTINNHLAVSYSKSGLAVIGETGDYITGSNKLQVYLWWNSYIKSWNIAVRKTNENYTIKYCNFKVQYIGHLATSPSILLNQNYTEADADVSHDKYFVTLSDGDTMLADITCYSNDTSYSDVSLQPMDMQLVTPTGECKTCQLYEWSVQQRDISKAKSIGDNVVTIANYIKQLFMLNFEIWLMLFWVFLILMVFVGIGLIFLGAYWFYVYLKKLTK